MQTFDPMLLRTHLPHRLADVVPNCKTGPFSCSGRRQRDLSLASPRFENFSSELNRSESILLDESKFCSAGLVKHSDARLYAQLSILSCFLLPISKVPKLCNTIELISYPLGVKCTAQLLCCLT